MPDSQVLSLTGAGKIVDLIATGMANSVLHLWKAGTFAPTPTTPLADFTTNEADFSGYAAVTVVDVGDPFLLGAGWAIEVTERFDYDSGSGSVGNQIGGWYWVTAAGVLMEYGVFDPTRPVQGDGQVVFVTAVLPIAAGQVL